MTVPEDRDPSQKASRVPNLLDQAGSLGTVETALFDAGYHTDGVRSVAIFRATRNGVRPISGANNLAPAIAFGGLRSSRRALRAAPGIPQRSDAVSHGLAFRLRRRSRAALRPNARPYAYPGSVALRSALTLPRFPVLLQKASKLGRDHYDASI